MQNRLLRYYPYDFYDFLARPVPILGRALRLFQTLGLTFAAVPTISLVYRNSPPSASVLSSLSLRFQASLSPDLWRQLFFDILLSYPDRSPIYTDGSFINESVGCGVYSPSFSLKARLPSGSSVFTAELYALYAAVNYVSRLGGSYIIFTDSLSSITALRSHTAPTHFLISWLLEAFASMPPGKLVVEWVPGHMGIPGNEVADTLATAWTVTFPLITHFKPLLGNSIPISLSRPDQVVVTRLRLGGM